ncbi:hypothetical protein BH23CHL8_BH23CHL8_13650 [soil metagenome]
MSSGALVLRDPEAAVPAPAAPTRPSTPEAPEKSSTESRKRAVSRAEAPTAARVPRTRTRTRVDSLTSRASAELTYVTDDLRRIAVVSLVMLACLVALWLLMAVIDPFSVY